MAMLAEPRRKSKYSVDPRGLNWSQDEDKFGQKMLEKMGWKQGKGLGANENGIMDHVAVKHKFDQKGVGCSKSHADNWIAHQDDFNALLSSLNQSGDSNNPPKDDGAVISLEHKSKTSRARVHYMKFTKGKDLSSKNNQDLDCVFGRRKSKSAPATPQNQSETENSDIEMTDTAEKCSTDKSHGVITVKNSLSVSDYFAQKMQEVKARLKKVREAKEPEQRSEATKEMMNSDVGDYRSYHTGEIEKISQGSKVTEEEKGVVTKSQTAPGSLCSLVEGAGDTDDKPRASSGDEVTVNKRKSKKGSKRKETKELDIDKEDSLEGMTASFTLDGEEVDEECALVKPKKRRKPDKEGSSRSEEAEMNGSLKTGKSKKKKGKKENPEEIKDDKRLKGESVEETRCGGETRGSEDLKKSKKKKRDKNERDLCVEGICGLVEITEGNSGIGGTAEEMGSNAEIDATTENSNKIVDEVDSELNMAGTQHGSKLSEAIKKKKKKRKKDKEVSLEREDCVKIEACTNEKKIKQDPEALKRQKEKSQFRKELGFAGSNLGDIVGYGVDSLMCGKRDLDTLTTESKKNSKKRS